MLLAVAVTTTLLFVGCKNAGSGDPKTVLMAFFEALSKKDFTAAKKLATKDSEGMFSMMEMGMSMAKDKDTKEMDKFDKTKMEFGEAVINGDKATVPVKDKSSGESTNFILKKEDGKWKVAFDKASLMQMGTDKMNEKGLNSTDVMDSVGNAMDKLKNMDTDSLANQMKQGLDKLKEIQEKNPDAAKKMQEAMDKLKEATEKMKQ